MIYTDGIHLISDVSISELHEFAELVGIKRGWFDANKKHPHYDIPRKLVQVVYEKGAIKTTSKHIVLICKEIYESKI